MLKQLGIISLLTLSITVFAAEQAADKTQEKPKKEPLALATNAFLDQGVLPVLYTCDGKDESPQLSWSNIPKNAKALTLIMVDKDAPSGDFYHWVAYNIPTKVKELPQGTTKLPAGVAGTNSYDKQSYSGPCPPKGSAHTYEFNLYALDKNVSLPKGAKADEVLKAIKGHVVGEATLTAVYSRWINA